MPTFMMGDTFSMCLLNKNVAPVDMCLIQRMPVIHYYFRKVLFTIYSVAGSCSYFIDICLL